MSNFFICLSISFILILFLEGSSQFKCRVIYLLSRIYLAYRIFIFIFSIFLSIYRLLFVRYCCFYFYFYFQLLFVIGPKTHYPIWAQKRPIFSSFFQAQIQDPFQPTTRPKQLTKPTTSRQARDPSRCLPCKVPHDPSRPFACIDNIDMPANLPPRRPTPENLALYQPCTSRPTPDQHTSLQTNGQGSCTPPNYMAPPHISVLTLCMATLQPLFSYPHGLLSPRVCTSPGLPSLPTAPRSFLLQRGLRLSVPSSR